MTQDSFFLKEWQILYDITKTIFGHSVLTLLSYGFKKRLIFFNEKYGLCIQSNVLHYFNNSKISKYNNAKKELYFGTV